MELDIGLYKKEQPNYLKFYCTHHPALKHRKETLTSKFKQLNIEVVWVEGYPPTEINDYLSTKITRGEMSLLLIKI